jgi:hypothetical protein
MFNRALFIRPDSEFIRDINKKGIESENRTTIGHWSVEHRQKGINKPKRGYCFTMEQTNFGRIRKK